MASISLRVIQASNPPAKAPATKTSTNAAAYRTGSVAPLMGRRSATSGAHHCASTKAAIQPSIDISS
jgi:hypothetical protein